MIDLRWMGDASFPTPRLQMRVLLAYMDASGAINVAGAKWSEWKDVPFVPAPDTAGEKP